MTCCTDHAAAPADGDNHDARCVAGLSGDQAYAKHVTGADPHGEAAKLFFGTPEQRPAAKTITHGINYGRGTRSIAAQTGKSVAEVQRLIRAHFEAYPNLASWQHEVRNKGAAEGRLETGTGRHVSVERAKAHTQAPARVAQAAARDLAIVGLLRLQEAGLLPYLRLFLHDEVVLSVPSADADNIVAVVTSLMSFDWHSPSGLVIPIEAAAHQTTGPRWSDIYRSRNSRH